MAQISTCEGCEAYIARRRCALLPYVGRWVARTGASPSLLVKALKRQAHQREGHPGQPSGTVVLSAARPRFIR